MKCPPAYIPSRIFEHATNDINTHKFSLFLQERNTLPYPEDDKYNIELYMLYFLVIIFIYTTYL
jgi:hypothetical protein